MKENKFETLLDPQLKKTLRPLKEMPDRDAATAHHRKEQFIKSVIETRHQSVTFPRKQRPLIQKSKFYLWRNTMTVKIISIVLAVMIVLGGAGMGTVAASQNSLPDEILYPVKQWSENIRLDLTSNPEKLFDLQLDFADRRIDEYIGMVEEGTIPPEILMQQYQQFLELAAQLTEELEDPLKSQQQIQNRMQNQQQQIDMVQSIDPLLQQTRDMLKEQLHLMDCEEGEDCEFEPNFTLEQTRDQDRVDQPEGAGNPDANGYDGEYPEPQLGKDVDKADGMGHQGQNADDSITGNGYQNENPDNEGNGKNKP